MDPPHHQMLNRDPHQHMMLNGDLQALKDVHTPGGTSKAHHEYVLDICRILQVASHPPVGVYN